MDGYAVHGASTAGATADRPVRLHVVGEVAAGYVYAGAAMGPGEAVRIMTGAPMPEGADAIVPFEETDEEGLRAPGQAHVGVESVGVLKAAQPGRQRPLAGGGRAPGCHHPPAGYRASGGPDRGAGVDGDLRGGGGPTSARRDPLHRRRAARGPASLRPLARSMTPTPPDWRRRSREYGGIPRRMGIARDTVEALAAKLQEAMGDADLVLTSRRGFARRLRRG